MADKAKRKKGGFGSRGGPGAKHPNIIRVVRREQIDYEKLAYALVEIAKRQIEEKRLDESQDRQGENGSSGTKGVKDSQ